ncbi:hydrolase [Ancylomarina euxinus]|uniref:Hydrolase n=1 Tax=Ancylomarina euxinus TaxID=2283627 RepID=A0A425Y0K8_9BACT|nr:hydrolase [Ancylomarina euxinus]MCZ4695203.1 hydrolase [Ancylomarina euxinus]MUP15400.1 hydrolase [Ancylomarina euxinus]RRG21110.1 hydrolase [Ancylomarina euxinus]
MIIAVDFDGTIVEHRYPDLGKEIPFAIESLKLIQEQGHQLILWTYRAGKELDAAVEFCKENGLEFYAVNKNYPEEIFDDSISRKINADIYIDDRNFGGLPSWGEIYMHIQGENTLPFWTGHITRKKGFSQLIRNFFEK